VSEFTHLARQFIEEAFSLVQIEGEISNFVKSSAGHAYFSLKDNRSQIRCVLFRSQFSRLKMVPENGLHVRIKASASLYEGRGDFQLIVQQVEEIGLGALQRQFDQLKKQLYERGWFDPAHKKPLPLFPETIGVITSPTGAAVRDVIQVLNRRYPLATVIVYPTRVQGDQAPDEIIQAITLANRHNQCQLLIVCRGGGSIEDLWAFNEEKVAKAIFDSTLPIITGVGHEIDFTIADFVSDVRAPTPSAAAEIAVPDSRKLINQLLDRRNQLNTHLQRRFSKFHTQLAELNQRIIYRSPQKQLQRQHEQLSRLRLTLLNLQQQALQTKKIKLAQLIDMLAALNPLAVLQRGYAVLKDTHQKCIHNIQQLKPKDKITALLHQGTLSCTVDAIFLKE
jgi:exodeoxyribonuclease VII large subunit